MKSLKSALDRIEADIVEVKRQYDLFFRGVRRTEPSEERRGLEWMVRQFGQRKIPNTSDQFRFSTLQGKFQSLANLWSRTVRDLEEGRISRDATGAVVRVGFKESSPVDREHLETVLEQIREARTECGMPTGPEETESLRKTLLDRARQIAQKTGAETVEFRVSVEDGKPKVRAGKS
jgi:hypothetical protein